MQAYINALQRVVGGAETLTPDPLRDADVAVIDARQHRDVDFDSWPNAYGATTFSLGHEPESIILELTESIILELNEDVAVHPFIELAFNAGYRFLVIRHFRRPTPSNNIRGRRWSFDEYAQLIGWEQDPATRHSILHTFPERPIEEFYPEIYCGPDHESIVDDYDDPCWGFWFYRSGRLSGGGLSPRNGWYRLRILPGDPANALCSQFRLTIAQFPNNPVRSAPLVVYPPQSGDRDVRIRNDDIIEAASPTRMPQETIFQSPYSVASVFNLPEALDALEAHQDSLEQEGFEENPGYW